MKQSRTLAVGVSAVMAMSLAALSPVSLAASGGHKGGKGTPVGVRVEGISKTLLAETTVFAKAANIDKDGKPADVCEGDTAAVALQDATHGNWAAGTFSSGLGYPVIAIFGESYPFTSSYYWSFWVDNKPATTGICGATVHRGDRFLFFPQCSQEVATSCPQGLFNPNVLALSAPKRARAGKAITVSVSALANLTGKASHASGVKLSAGGHVVTTGASGKARLTFAKAGSYRILATAPDAVRDELTVRVSR